MNLEHIIGAIVVAIVAGSFGWALSQLTTGRRVQDALAATQLLIEKCSNDTNRTQDEVAGLRSQTALQINGMSSLVEKVLDTANKLIEIVRIQNALLNQKEK